VYRSFESLADFEAEIATLRAARAAVWPHGDGPGVRPDDLDAMAVAENGLNSPGDEPGTEHEPGAEEARTALRATAR
jgi:hypothetical protein